MYLREYNDEEKVRNAFRQNPSLSVAQAQTQLSLALLAEKDVIEKEEFYNYAYALSNKKWMN